MPPLRERKEDIPLLVEYFIKRAAVTHGVQEKRISEDALALLENYNWPGNIRELRYVIERALILSKGDIIKRDDIVLNPVEKIKDRDTTAMTEIKPLIEMEKDLIQRALKVYKNKKEAARVLGIDPSTLYRKMKKYGIKEE